MLRCMVATTLYVGSIHIVNSVMCACVYVCVLVCVYFCVCVCFARKNSNYW